MELDQPASPRDHVLRYDTIECFYGAPWNPDDLGNVYAKEILRLGAGSITVAHKDLENRADAGWTRWPEGFDAGDIHVQVWHHHVVEHRCLVCGIAIGIPPGSPATSADRATA